MLKKIALFIVIFIYFIFFQYVSIFADDVSNSDDSFIWSSSNISEYISTISNNTETVPSINSRSAIVIDRKSRKYFI